MTISVVLTGGHAREVHERELAVERVYRNAIRELFARTTDIAALPALCYRRQVYRHISNRSDRAGTLRSSELADAGIAVTNLGDQGVASVFGVICPPQVALPGFGRIALRPWVSDDGMLRAVPVVTASLAADHRTSDGHRGARLLAEIRERLGA